LKDLTLTLENNLLSKLAVQRDSWSPGALLCFLKKQQKTGCICYCQEYFFTP